MWILKVFLVLEIFIITTESGCSSVNIIDRAGWKAKNVVSKATNLMSASNLPVKLVFIHHSAGGFWPWFEPRCFTKVECIEKVQRIEQEKHTVDKGYDDIGYNYLVGEDGNAYEGRGWRKVGGHSWGYNNFSIAICVLGNFVDDTPKTEALDAIQALIDCAIVDKVLSPDYELFGHMDIGETECPGQQLYSKINLWPKYSTKLMQKYKDKMKVPLPLPCRAYGDITELRASGIKSATATREGLHFSGKVASNYLIDQDILELENYRSCFVHVGTKYGIHPAVIGALASRISRAGKNLTLQGYGTEDPNKYGLMQCNTRSPVYGSRCTQYGPQSCDHIQMMIDDKLVPDARAAIKKYMNLYNKEERGLRDAIAAYEHTITEVQSWPLPDSKTNGGDFSNDVIARAHRLIRHHKWTCNGTSPSPNLPGSSGNIVPKPGPDNCKALADRGDCNFYIECVDKVVHCTEEGYALGYGYKYCNRFAQFYNDFSAEGKIWVDAVRICLMNALLPHIAKHKSCNDISTIAFDTHVKCYLDSGPGICSVAFTDMGNLWSVYQVKDFFGKYGLKAWKQVAATIYSCSGAEKVIDDSKEFSKDINRQINAWEKSIINEAVQQAIRGKRSTECEEYVQLGDCRFYECFEDKFACAEHEGYSHIRDFELTSCMKFKILSSSNSKVGAWMTSTQHCLMDHLMTLYNQDSLDCEMVELHMLEARVSCMVDAGFCSLDSTDEWMIERATDRKGYPYIAPTGYTTLPESRKTIQIDEYYYQTLYWLKMQIGLASEKCYESGARQNKDIYKYVDTANYGTLKIRTEL